MIHQAKRDGKVIGWEAVVEWGEDPATGKRRRRTRLAPTKAEARELERELEAEWEETWGGTGSDARVGAYLLEWLRQVKEDHSAGTFKVWEGVVRLRLINTSVAKMKLSAVKPKDIKSLVRSWGELSISPRTRAKYYECLHAAFEAAVKDGELARNPVSSVPKPKWDQRDPTVWTPDEWQTFVDACWASSSRYADVILLVAYTGCRIGEVVSLDERYTDIERGFTAIMKGKTDSSRGAVPLLAPAVAAITRARKRQEAEKVGWADKVRFTEHWLLRNPAGHRIGVRGAEDWFQETRVKLGLPYTRPHDLRHYIGTQGLVRGLVSKRVGDVLRHRSSNVTETIYQHALLSTKRQDLQAILMEDSDACPHCGGTGRIVRQRERGEAK